MEVNTLKPEESLGGAVETPTVKSAERTVRILEALATAPGRLTIAELQAQTGYPRSSLHALVRTLREMKWVEADETGSAFGVGPHALLSGTSYLDKDPALAYVYPLLEDMRAELGYTIHYARRDQADVIYLATRESREAVRTVSRVGRRLPVHATALGQALLAALTPEEVDALLPPQLAARTPYSITDRAELTSVLDEVRARGWAFEREQSMAGVACVAAAVDYRIPPTDAVSCSMPVQLAKGEELDRVIAAMTTYPQQLAGELRRAGIR